MAPSCCAIADPDILAAFDPTVLYRLIAPHRAYFRSRGCTLPKRCGVPLPIPAVMSVMQQGGVADFPMDLAEALHAIVEIGVHATWPTILRTARDTGIDLQRLGQGNVTPRNLAARLWLTNPDLVRRLQVEAIRSCVRQVDRWRCDPEDRPVAPQTELERCLVAWARDLDEILAEHHCPRGTRIWLQATGERLDILVRHGAALRRGTSPGAYGGRRGLFFQPAVTDLLRYDVQHGELGLALAEPSRWLADALRSTCSAWLFREPQLFCRACGDRAPSPDDLTKLANSHTPIALDANIVEIEVRTFIRTTAGH